MNFKNISAVILATLAFSELSYAAKPGPYIGGGLGYSSLENFIDTSKKSTGGVGGQAFAGYNFNKNIGIEIGYRSYAKTTYNIDGYNNLTFDYNLHSINLVSKAYIPLSNTNPVDLYFLLGIADVYGNGNIKYHANRFDSISNNAILATVGFGLNYQINPHVTAGIEYSYTNGMNGTNNNIGIPNSNLTTLNVAYNLG